MRNRGHVGEWGVALHRGPNVRGEVEFFHSKEKRGKGRNSKVPLAPATEAGANFTPSPSPASRMGSQKLRRAQAGVARGRRASPSFSSRSPAHHGPRTANDFSAENRSIPKALKWAAECCGVGRDRVNEGK